MTRSQIQLPGLDVGIPFFLPSWVVLPLALCFGGGSKGSASSVYANQQQKAPPAPPPAPPKASEATAATKYLIRDIASQRSRQTTVLTRERNKLTPGNLAQPFTTVLTSSGNNSPEPLPTGQTVTDTGAFLPGASGSDGMPYSGPYDNDAGGLGFNSWGDPFNNPFNNPFSPYGPSVGIQYDPVSPTFGGGGGMGGSAPWIVSNWWDSDSSIIKSDQQY